MNTKLTIKNFRVFDENGVTIDLAPITILTGCNSSGKSSIMKAVLLLDSFLKQIKNARENNYPIEIDKYKLDFTIDLHRQLGNFNNVVHDGSSQQKIAIEYEVYSLMLSKNITAKLVFCANENDELNNGYLDSITLYTEDCEIFHSDKKNGNRFNFNCIKEDAIDFLRIDFIVHNYCNLYSAENVSKDEFELSKKQMESFIAECNETRKYDIIKYARIGYNRDSIVNRRKVDPNIVSWSINNGYSLFYIPVIEELNNIDKKIIKEYINKKFLKKANATLKHYSCIIIDDFLKSEYTTLGAYFGKYEMDFLNDFPIFDPFSLKDTSLIDKILSLTRARHTINYFANNKVKQISFEMLYDVIMNWNFATFVSKNEFYEFNDSIGERTYHYMFNRLMTCFASDLILEILTPNWCGNIQYTSSARTKVKRLYTFDDKNDFSDLLKRYFDCKRDFVDRSNQFHKNNYKPDKFMNEWIRGSFNIGNKIKLLPSSDGLGVRIMLYKTADDKKGRLLADEGYGITSLVGILLQIEIAILSAKGMHINRYYGGGLDKLDGFDSKKFYYEHQVISIEEPEIHLHPRYQSILADMIIDAYKKYNIHFMIETHSEYLIRRLQVLAAKPTKDTSIQINNKDISILYINSLEDVKNTGVSLVKHIKICKDGYLDDTFGTGFYDVSTNLSRMLMQL